MELMAFHLLDRGFLAYHFCHLLLRLVVPVNPGIAVAALSYTSNKVQSYKGNLGPTALASQA